MKETIYLSRSFVEFGPFSAAEMQDFYKRGILQDSDYVSVPAGSWTHVNDWAATLGNSKAAPAKKSAAPAPAPAPKAKAPEPAPAPAKKAAVKKAKK
jgi:hypothetical protein